MRRSTRERAVAGILALLLQVAQASGAQVPSTGSPPGEVIVEVRVHGNYATPDADVMTLAGITIGQALGPGGLEAIRTRLNESRRFAEVEVRKRFRSLKEGTEVVLVILVREYPTAEAAPVVPGVRPPRAWAGPLMVLPVLDYVDGYGFTYGARLSVVDALGRGGRVSTPLTWGGTKRAAVELDKDLPRGPVHRLEAGASVSQRENPFYEEDEDRREAWVRASRAIAPALRLGARVGYADVSFADVGDTYVTYGADLTLDTRADPAFPRNAVLASVSWEGLDFDASPTANRYRLDTQGYLGLVGTWVAAVHATYETSDRELPPYLTPLLGGANTLRGFRAGSFADDNLFAASAEIRVPFTSPMRIARTGFTVFADVGASYPRGVSLSDAPFHTGVGGGLFLIAPLIRMGVDVAYGVNSGTYGHFAMILRF